MAQLQRLAADLADAPAVTQTVAHLQRARPVQAARMKHLSAGGLGSSTSNSCSFIM